MKEKCLFILVILVLITGPALAGGVNVADEFGFGALIEPTFTSTSPAGILGFAISIDARVYLKDGTYTYVYGLSDKGTGTSFFGTSGISSVSIVAPDFDPALGWGTVGDLPPGIGFNTTFSGGLLTFQFSPALPSGNTAYTVYAQSTMAPQMYLFYGLGLGPTGEGAYTWGADPPPTALPEAPSFFLLSTGLLGLGFFRQRFN